MVSVPDWVPVLFLVVLVSAPTLLLVRRFAKSEAARTKYAKVLFYVSLTGPLSVSLILALQGIGNFNLVFVPRVVVSPIVLLVIIVSSLSARFGGAQWRVLCALLSEAVTSGLLVLWITVIRQVA